MDTDDPKYRFRFINSISETKAPLRDDPYIERDYNAVFINKFLSMYPDTIMHAQMMNRNYTMPKQAQFDYLLNNVRSMRRTFKRAKKPSSDNDENVEVIQEYFRYNRRKAIKVLPLLSKETIDAIKQSLEKGGAQKQKNG